MTPSSASPVCNFALLARRCLLFGAVTAIASWLPAQILGARPAPVRPPGEVSAARPLAWTPLPVTFSRKIVLWDNLEVAKLIMNFGPGTALQVDASLFTDWERAATPGASVSWSQGPAVITLSALRFSPTRDALDPKIWPGLAAALRDRRAAIQRVICDDDSELNGQMLRLLGLRTRVYECEFILPSATDQVRRQVVAACSDGNTTYVFTLEGLAAQTHGYYHTLFERALFNFRFAGGESASVSRR